MTSLWKSSDSPEDGVNKLLHSLRIEIKRAQRFQYGVSLMIIECPNPPALGIERALLSGEITSEKIYKELREYDLVIRLDKRKFALILPFNLQVQFASAIQTRLYRIFPKYRCSNFAAGISAYPDNGDQAEQLFQICQNELTKPDFSTS
ncbi:hypothetical protein ISS30_11395 [bacterium]|nr:hypothetical protein [bacterium]